MKEHINIEKCSTFEQMMLYLMTTVKETDEREYILKYGWTPFGEMERYNRFGIDFQNEKVKFINDLCDLDVNDPKWKLDNQFQKVAVEAAKLFEMLKDYYNV